MPRLIKIRRYRNRWQCFEGTGVEPYWVDSDAKEQALGYGKQRDAKTEGSEIRILNEEIGDRAV
jgi:hypothetical protein